MEWMSGKFNSFKVNVIPSVARLFWMNANVWEKDENLIRHQPWACHMYVQKNIKIYII